MRNFIPQFLSLMFSIFATPLSSADVANYIQCSDMGLFFGDCHLREKTLFSESRFERKFTIRYSFPCLGHDIEAGFRTESGFLQLKASPDAQEVVLTGRSLKLVDRNPQATSRSTFDSKCELTILNARSLLSSSSKDTLKLFKEECSLISSSVESLWLVSQLTRSILEHVGQANFENLRWQRDQLRNMLNRIYLGELPTATRISFSSILRTIDEMMTNSENIDSNSLHEKLRIFTFEIYNATSLQMQALLNRVSELRLRTTEILAEAEDTEVDWAELYGLFDSVSEKLAKPFNPQHET